MIDIKELLYDIDLKLNKVGTSQHQGIPLEDKLIALNDVQINLLKTKFSENNVYKLGMDAFQKRYNDLEIFVEKDRYLTLKQDSGPLKSWSADLSKLKPEYLLGIPGSEYIVADKGSCKQHPLVVSLIKHGNISIVLNNSNTAPSFEYQEVPGVISGHRYQVFTDGTFTPSRFYLWYVRYPNKVDYEGYEHLDGSISKIVDSEFPYYMKEEITDMAVRNLAMMTENQSALQSSQIKIQTNE